MKFENQNDSFKKFIVLPSLVSTAVTRVAVKTLYYPTDAQIYNS